MKRIAPLTLIALITPHTHAQPCPTDGYAIELVLDDIVATGMAMSDGIDGFPAGLYIAAGDAILLLDGDGLSSFAPNVPNAAGLAFSAGFGGEPALYAVENGANDVYRISPDGSSEVFATLSAGGEVNLNELAVSTDALGFDGALYATDFAGAGGNAGRIFRIFPDGDFEIVFENQAYSNAGVIFDEQLGLVVADMTNGGIDGDGGVWAFDAQLQPELLISTADTDLFDPVEVIRAGGPLFPSDLLLADFSADAVFLASLEGDVTPVVTHLAIVSAHAGGDLLLEPEGTLLITDTVNNRIWRVVEDTGGCPADCNADAVLNVLDFVCFQIRFQNALPDADCNGDCTLSILDFVCFQQQFAAGCP